jgi:hypothetical protein
MFYNCIFVKLRFSAFVAKGKMLRRCNGIKNSQNIFNKMNFVYS